MALSFYVPEDTKHMPQQPKQDNTQSKSLSFFVPGDNAPKTQTVKKSAPSLSLEKEKRLEPKISIPKKGSFLNSIKNEFTAANNLVGKGLGLISRPGDALRNLSESLGKGDIKGAGKGFVQGLTGQQQNNPLEFFVKPFVSKPKLDTFRQQHPNIASFAEMAASTIDPTIAIGGAKTATGTKALLEQAAKNRAMTGIKGITKDVVQANPTSKIANIVSGKTKNKFNLGETLHDIYTHTVDASHPLNRLIKNVNAPANLDVRVMANNAKNAGGTARHIVDNALVNREGQTIGKGYNKIISQVSKKDMPLFDEYLLQKHNISRMAVDKPVFGKDVTAEMSKAKVAELEKAHPEFKTASQGLNKFMSDFSNAWGVGTGRTSKDLMDMLHQRYPDYVPTYRAGDPNYVKLTDTNGTVSTGNFIKNAKGGSNDIIRPTESIPKLINRTVKSARENEVYQSILNAVEKNPEGMKAQGITLTKTGQDTLSELKNVNGIEDMANFEQLKLDAKKGNVLTVMVQGKPVSLRIDNPRVINSIKELHTGHVAGPIEKVARKTTGPFKALITGQNPIFAAKNIARDVPTAIVNTANHPIRFAKSMVTGAKDIITNSPQFQEYKALGGEGGNFFNENPITKHNPISKFNNLTETAPRYAEYKATVKKGGNTYASKMQGIYNANDITTNFGRYGDLTKSADAFIPYLNPGVQGLDKLARQIIKHPISTIAKGAATITAPALILDKINQNDPNYQKLDNRTKDNYFVINKGDGTFWKIPKSRELGVLFGSLEQRIARAVKGDQGAFKGFGGTVATNFAPSNPIENNIASPVIWNLPRNKDFANRTIVPQGMQDRSPKFQYDEKTSEIAKKIGSLTNLSPKQVDYLIKSYTGVIGQLGLPLATKSNSGNNIQQTIGNTLKTQFTSDPAYSNEILNNFYDNWDKLKQVAADKNFTQNIPSKVVTPEEHKAGLFTKASAQMSALRKKSALIQAKNIPQADKNAQLRNIQLQILDIANKANAMVK